MAPSKVNIYVRKYDKRYGPFTLEKLKEYAGKGSISPSDPAIIEGMKEWTTVADIVQMNIIPSFLLSGSIPPQPVKSGSGNVTDSVKPKKTMQVFSTEPVSEKLKRHHIRRVIPTKKLVFFISIVIAALFIISNVYLFQDKPTKHKCTSTVSVVTIKTNRQAALDRLKELSIANDTVALQAFRDSLLLSIKDDSSNAISSDSSLMQLRENVIGETVKSDDMQALLETLMKSDSTASALINE